MAAWCIHTSLQSFSHAAVLVFVVSSTTANESCVSAQYVSENAFVQLDSGFCSFKLLPTHLPAPSLLQSLADWWLAQLLACCASFEVWLAHKRCPQLPADVLRRNLSLS